MFLAKDHKDTMGAGRQPDKKYMRNQSVLRYRKANQSTTMQRRLFLKQSLLSTGVLAVSHDLLANVPQKAIKPFGVQLYSVRDLMPKDPKGTMTRLAKLGYKQFESYAGPQGFLWGMAPKEAKIFLDDLGVKMVSTHFDFKKDLDKSIDMANGAGLTYLLCPYIGAQKSLDDWKKVADLFNEAGEKVRKGGLKFGYHNHDYSFKPLNGTIPQVYLLENTDPNNVMFELDMCWIEAAGQDANQHLIKYGNRYELCHVKDFNRVGGKVVQTDLGTGSVNYKKLLRTAMDNGMKYFIIEQEDYPQSPMVSMKNDAAYMQKLTV